MDAIALYITPYDLVTSDTIFQEKPLVRLGSLLGNNIKSTPYVSKWRSVVPSNLCTL
jgi:hypothetical protein